MLIRSFFVLSSGQPTKQSKLANAANAAAAPAVAVVVLNHLAIIRTLRVELAGVQGITNPRLPISPSSAFVSFSQLNQRLSLLPCSCIFPPQFAMGIFSRRVRSRQCSSKALRLTNLFPNLFLYRRFLAALGLLKKEVRATCKLQLAPGMRQPLTLFAGEGAGHRP